MNRLVSARLGTNTPFTYVYDAAGRRQSKTVNGVTTSYLYDGSDLIGEYDGSGNILRLYVHGPGSDAPLAVEGYNASGARTTRKYFFRDERGSVIAVADKLGAVAAGDYYTYGPYGEPNNPTTGALFRYTGQVYDPETGLYHYKARAYSATLGRFLQPDPIGYGDGMNMYGYVGGDPVNMRDPSGMAGNILRSDSFVDWIDDGIGGRCGPSISFMSGCNRVDDGHSAGFWACQEAQMTPREAQEACNKAYGFKEDGTPATKAVYVCTGFDDQYACDVDLRTASASDLKGLHVAPGRMTVDATGNLISALSPNGCGSAEQDVPDFAFGSACYNHDKCYATVGMSKGQCDFQFWRDMIEIAEGVGDPQMYAELLVLANQYAGAVANSSKGGTAYARAQRLSKFLNYLRNGRIR